MSTFLEMVQTIQDDLGVRSGNQLNAEIRAAINAAIADFESQRFRFNEGTDTSLVTVANDPSYSLPATMLDIDEYEDDCGVTYGGVELTNNGRSFLLQPITHGQYLARKPSSSSSEPYAYAIQNETLFLLPAPNAVMPITLYGVVRQSNVPLTADGQSNDWTTVAEKMVKSRAKAYLYAERLNNSTMAQTMEAIVSGQKSRLASDRNRLLVRGHVQATQF